MLTMHRTERVNTDHVHKVRVAEQRADVHSTQPPCWTCCKASLQRTLQSDNYCIICLTTLPHHKSDNSTTSPARQQHYITSQTTALHHQSRQHHWLDHQSDNGTRSRQTTALNWQSDNGTGWITHQKMALAGSPVRQRPFAQCSVAGLSFHPVFCGRPALSPSVLWPACPFAQCSVAGLSFHPVFCGRPVLSPSVLWLASPFTQCSVAGPSFHPVFCGRPVLSPSVLWPARPFTRCSVAGPFFHPVFCGRPILSPSVLWPVRPSTQCSVATRGQPNPGHRLASKHRELCISFHLQAPFGWSVNSHTQAPREQPSWFTLHQIQ